MKTWLIIILVTLALTGLVILFIGSILASKISKEYKQIQKEKEDEIQRRNTQ